MNDILTNKEMLARHQRDLNELKKEERKLWKLLFDKCKEIEKVLKHIKEIEED